MDRLPQEVLDQILGYIAPADQYDCWSALRLLDKRLAASVAPHLFSVLPFWMSNQSLEKLHAISLHNEL